MDKTDLSFGRFSWRLSLPFLLQGLAFGLLSVFWGKRDFADLGRHLLAMALLGQGLALACVAWGKRFKASLGFLACLPALGFSLQGLCSLASLISLQLWGQQATLGMLERFLPEMPLLSRQLSLPGWTAPLLCLAWLGGSWSLYRFILKQGISLQGPRGLSPALAGSLAISAAIYVAANIGSGLQTWRNDLVLGLFKDEQASVPMTPERLTALVADRKTVLELGARPAAARSVVLILVDAGRADHLGVYGYSRPTTPYLSSLAAQGSLQKVDWAFSSGPVTFSSVLAMQTSKALSRASLESFSLCDYFKQQGYQVDALASGDLHWYGLKDLFARSCDLFLDGLDQPYGAGSSDDRWIPQALAQLPQASAKPAFIYLHLMAAHNIGVTDPQFMRYLPSRNLAPWKEWIARNSSPQAKQAIVNNYDNRILQVDSEIKGALGILQAKGYLDNTIICVTADHGQFLGEHGDFGHQHGLLYNEGLHVPLIFWGSGMRRLKEARFSCGLDLGPSLADLAGLKIPPFWEGRSLFQAPEPRLTLHQNLNASEGIEALISWDGKRLLKYIRQLSPAGSLLNEQLYDVMKDPQETQDLAPGADPAQLARFRAVL